MSTLLMKRSGIEGNEIDQIKANDERALRHLYVSNYDNVERFVLSNSGSAEDARDIYQEAFIATWRNITLGKFTEMHEGSVNAYLFCVAKNKWLDVLRTRKRRIVPVDFDESLHSELSDGLDEDEAQYLTKVRLHFQAMGGQCKELLRRFYFHKESMKQLSARFSWTEATTKNNKYRCLQKLRASILKDK